MLTEVLIRLKPTTTSHQNKSHLENEVSLFPTRRLFLCLKISERHAGLCIFPPSFFGEDGHIVNLLCQGL